MPATGVHFNGSVNLPDAETVMREISTRIPTGVRRMTEGETGNRNHWVFFQREKFAAVPEFEEVPIPETGGDYERIPILRLVAGISPADVTWPDIGYAAAYFDSFETFRKLQDDGVIESGARLQLQFPTPIAALSMVSPDDAQRLAPYYADALFADLHRDLDRLPHDRIAVQWDVAVEIGLLTGAFPVEPPTVPQGRGDSAYFEPLLDLRADPATELAFALAPYHPDDQPIGTTTEQAKLIDTWLEKSSGGVRDWSVCTECGMGRVDREDVPRLLDLHREIVNGQR